MMPCACAAASASASCHATSTASATGIGPRCRRADSVSPSTYSKTTMTLPVDVEHVVHGGDVRMIERGGGARLAHQALAAFGGVGVGAS